MSAEFKPFTDLTEDAARGDLTLPSNMRGRCFGGAPPPPHHVPDELPRSGISAGDVTDAMSLVQSVARQLREAEEDSKAREKHVHSVVTHITNELETARKRIEDAERRAKAEADRADAAEVRAEGSERAFHQLLATINAEFRSALGS